MKNFDVAIIGGGPIGIACGLEAQQKGLSYIIFEKGPIVNSLYNYPVNMQFFSSSERLEIDDIPFISKEAKPSRSEALEYYRRISERLRHKNRAITSWDYEQIILENFPEVFKVKCLNSTN